MDKEWSVVAALVVVIALVCSPLHSVYAVASGLADHNTKRVASYVDFPSLRSSLKAKLTASALQNTPGARMSAGSALGSAFGMLLVDGLIDRMVTPDGLVALFSKARPTQVGSVEIRKVFGLLRMNGLTEVDLVSPDDPSAYLVFRTDNLVTWKLTDFVVPDASSERKTLAEASTR